MGGSLPFLPPCGGPLGPKLVTASADMTSRVYNVANGACVACFQGHEGEISKACLRGHAAGFNRSGGWRVTRAATWSLVGLPRWWCLQTERNTTGGPFAKTNRRVGCQRE